MRIYPNDSNHFSVKFAACFIEIKQICDELWRRQLKSNRWSPYQWVQKQANLKRHPEAVLYALQRLNTEWKTIKNIWAYLESIMKIENGNYNEREYISENEKKAVSMMAFKMPKEYQRLITGMVEKWKIDVNDVNTE